MAERELAERRIGARMAQQMWRWSVSCLLFVLSLACVVGGTFVYQQWIITKQHDIRIRKNTESINASLAVERYTQRLDRIIELLEERDDARTDL